MSACRKQDISLKTKHMNTALLKKSLPYAGAIVLFIVLTMTYLNPLLEGKRLRQSDIMQFKGMSKEILDYREQTGEEALWTNSMFGGMPAYQISVLYTKNLSYYLHKIFTLNLPHPADIVFLYFVGFFVLLLVLGLSPWAAAAGAIAFAFSSYHFIIIDAGHNTKAIAIAYMAPVLAGIIVTLRGRLLWGGIFTAIALGLQLQANHLQITYYLAIFVVIYGIFELYYTLIEKRTTLFLKAMATLVVAALLAVGMNFTNFITTLEYTPYTMRGPSELKTDEANHTGGLDKDYITAWSYGKAETLSLLIPNVKGGATGALGNNEAAMEKVSQFKNEVAQQNHYWGDQPFTSGPVYVGAIVMLLFFTGLFLIQHRYKWVILTAVLLSIFLAWGRNMMWFTDIFLTILPGYNKFRAVSMTLVIAEFAIPLLAMLAFKEILDKPDALRQKRLPLLIGLGVTAGITLILALIPTAFFNFLSQMEAEGLNAQKISNPEFASQIDIFISNLETARVAIFRADAWRSLLFVLAAGLAGWLFVTKKINKTVFISIFIVLLLLDLWPINKRYLNNENFVAKRQIERPFNPTQADQQILADTDPYFRVYNRTVNTFNDATTSYFHKSIGGYHGAKLQRYQDIIDNHLSKNNMAVINMLNTKYVIVPDENRQPQARLNPDALGNAWFVQEIKWVDSPRAEIDALGQFDPSATAVVDKKFKDVKEIENFAFDSLASITLVSYKPNELVFKSQSQQAGLAVFSDIYYDKGWNAYINGEKMPHFRANYILRAMRIPQGNNEIVFRFDPRSYRIGESISLISSLLVLLAIAAGAFLLFSAKTKKETGQA